MTRSILEIRDGGRVVRLDGYRLSVWSTYVYAPIANEFAVGAGKPGTHLLAIAILLNFATPYDAQRYAKFFRSRYLDTIRLGKRSSLKKHIAIDTWLAGIKEQYPNVGIDPVDVNE